MDEAPFRFFNPYATTEESRNRLPHWEQSGVPYFVTFRLADSIPESLLDAWNLERTQWLEGHLPPWTMEVEKKYHRRFSGRLEHWLDAGHGSCLLKSELPRAEVINALLHFDGVRCRMVSCVVMPNHVHALFVLHPERMLAELIHSWKRHSAQKINRRLQRAGAVWQKDYFDRMIRDGLHFENCVRYIRRNPWKAGLRSTEFALYENEIAKSVE